MAGNESREPDRETASAAPGETGPGSREDRLSRLESQVVTLAAAVRALAHGLEHIPVQETAPDEVARGARLAHELLLSRGL